MSGSKNPVPAVAADDLVRVARIGKPHGIKGDVTVQLYTDAPEDRFASGVSLTALGGNESTHPVLTVKRARWNKDILVVGFEEIPDRNGAEDHRDVELFGEPSVDEEDAWYEEDLLNFSVRLLESPDDEIGKVSGLITGEAQDLLEITMVDGEAALVPLVEEIVPEIDEDDQYVLLSPPAGLLELNRSGNSEDQGPQGEEKAR